MSLQVAAQQGSYLSDCFNRMEKCEKSPEGPIRFRGEGRHRFRPFRYNLTQHPFKVDQQMAIQLKHIALAYDHIVLFIAFILIP